MSPLPRRIGWARFGFQPRALPILLLLSSSSLALCPLPIPADKGARIDEAFQHVTPSPGGFFELHWNSSGDSALAATRVPQILAALETARAHYLALPAAWDVPLGPRAAYPVLVVRQPVPGATTLPFSDGGVEGLTWIQLDHQPERWGGDPDELLEATCAHEFFHALQFAQGADLRNLAFYEASAVWAEDQVFPGHDDWSMRYLPALLENLTLPLDDTEGGAGLRQYGSGAVLKFLLAGQPDWGPCRLALQQGALTGRCWPILLGGLDRAAEPELAACLGELLRAGQADPSRRVPELADQATPSRQDFPALLPGSSAPEEARALPAQCWLPLPAAGGAQARVAGHGLFQLSGEGGTPLAVEDSSRVTLEAEDWLLVVNGSEAGRPGLTWLDWLASGPASFRVWPNPGGSLRMVEFAGSSVPLEIRNLLGQLVALWTPPGPGPGPWPLVLPSRSSATLLLWEPHSQRGIRLSVLR